MEWDRYDIEGHFLVGFWILKSMFLICFIPTNFSGETESFIWLVGGFGQQWISSALREPRLSSFHRNWLQLNSSWDFVIYISQWSIFYTFGYLVHCQYNHKHASFVLEFWPRHYFKLIHMIVVVQEWMCNLHLLFFNYIDNQWWGLP